MADNQQSSSSGSSGTFDISSFAVDVLNNSFEGVIVADGTKDHIIQYVNSAWQKNTGWSSADVVGKQNPRILKSGKQDAAFYATLWETILAGKLFHAEIVNKRKDGSLYDVEINIFPIKNENGQTMFVEVSRNITAEKLVRRQLEETIRKEKEHLEITVAEKTRELEEKISELEKINAIMVGRELKMIELKERIEELERNGREP